MSNNKLVVILGPTSADKTSATIRLCHKFNGEIVSADSRQIYKFMDLGTGKAPVILSSNHLVIEKGEDFWNVGGVKIWLYDVVAPGEYFSAVDFKKLAEEKISNIWSRGKVPFVVGGTGFYLDTLLGLKELAKVPANFKLRKELELLSTEKLAERLRSLDPKRYELIDKNNRRRLIRAVEIAIVGAHHDAPETIGLRAIHESPLRFPPQKMVAERSDAFQIGFTASHNFLYPRVDAWVDTIVQKGLIEETKDLIARGYKNTPQLQGLIYKTVVSFLDKQITVEDMSQRIKFDLHAYIRRQETYFKKMPNINWLDITKPTFDEELQTRVELYLNG